MDHHELSDAELFAQWKAARTRDYVTSNGLHLRIKATVELADLMAAGHVPLTLLSDVRAAYSKRMEDKLFGADGMAELAPSLNAVCIAAVAFPPVTPEGGEDSIAVTEIPLVDRLTIFNQVNAPAVALQSFRQGQASNGAAASDGEELRDTAVSADGD